MVVSSRIICLPPAWEEMLACYIRFKTELGLDTPREYLPEIYWKDSCFFLYEEVFNTNSTIDQLNKSFISFCETTGIFELTQNDRIVITKNDNSFEGSVYSSIPEMIDGNGKAFINFYGEVEQ